MEKIPTPQPSDDPAAFASYEASISGELARLSRENGLPTLAYILEMARLEARNMSLKESETVQQAQRSAMHG